MLVIVPWRPQPARVPMFDVVYERLQKNYSVDLADFPSRTFNRAATRNHGVLSSGYQKDSVVAFIDADTILDENVLEQAISHVKTYGGVAIPFDVYRSLSPLGTEQFLAGAPLDEVESTIVKGAVGGSIVTTVDAWWECGGMDERFRGWGYEDTAWRLAADLISPPVVFPGPAYAGAHPTPDRGGIETRRNRQMFQQYRVLKKNRAGMRKLVSDPARFPLTG